MMIVNEGGNCQNGSDHGDLMMMNVKKMMMTVVMMRIALLMMVMIFPFLQAWLSWVVQFCFSSGFTIITAITQSLFSSM